ncbi:MAG TPA: ATP-binding protein, partial [Gammaproteobacteria bacterium]|nr:ATP-binding protein [Gammaproteobacteria bacterium]
HSPPRQGLYTQEATGRTYTRLAELAATLLQCGYPVVVDATFLEGRERARFRGIAADHGVPFAIIETRAPDKVLRARIAPRLAAGRDASEADAAVLDHQLQSGSALSHDERARTVTVDTAQSLALNDILHQLAALTGASPGDH